MGSITSVGIINDCNEPSGITVFIKSLVAAGCIKRISARRCIHFPVIVMIPVTWTKLGKPYSIILINNRILIWVGEAYTLIRTGAIPEFRRYIGAMTCAPPVPVHVCNFHVAIGQGKRPVTYRRKTSHIAQNYYCAVGNCAIKAIVPAPSF